MKTPFVTLEKLREITAAYPTPFHLYDEAGIRDCARRIRAAFAWNPGFKEYFAVKATPNPQLLKILRELPHLDDYELLPYHTFGSNKYAELDYSYTMPELSTPDKAVVLSKNNTLRRYLGLPERTE